LAGLECPAEQMKKTLPLSFGWCSFTVSGKAYAAQIDSQE
jgi:hypothetical protein